jgi:hypothetical protein
MKSIADQLPADIARQIHPAWRKNEADYWAMRDQLLTQYQDQWIGFADGQVIVSGKSSVEAFHFAQQSGRHAFVTCVGREAGATRIRRASFPYNTSYHSQALPSISVEFRRSPGSQGIVLDGVIPDTGADASVIPWADCQSLQLDATQGVPNYFAGVAGGFTGTIVFTVCAD